MLCDILVDDFKAFKKKNRKYANRETLALIGSDIIISDRGHLHIVELNGQHSGTSGFIDAYGTEFPIIDLFKRLEAFGLPVQVYAFKQNVEKMGSYHNGSTTIDDIEAVRMQLSKQAMGLPEITDKEYFKLRKDLRGQEETDYEERFREIFNRRLDLTPNDKPIGSMQSMRQAEGIIWNHTSHMLTFDESRFILLNPHPVEVVLYNKFLTALAGYPYILGNHPMETLDRNSLQKAIGHNDSRKKMRKLKDAKIVLKPEDGRCGEGVTMLEISDLLTSDGKLRDDLDQRLETPEKYFPEDIAKNITYLRNNGKLLVQPYIKSRTFKSRKTGKDHYGCVRHIALVHSRKGKVRVHNLGAYVRLAKEPAGQGNASYVANYYTGRLAEPLSGRDLNRINRRMTEALSRVYLRLLKINLEDQIPLINYVLEDWKEKAFKDPWLWLDEKIF